MQLVRTPPIPSRIPKRVTMRRLRLFLGVVLFSVVFVNHVALAQTRTVDMRAGIRLVDHLQPTDADLRVIGTMIDPPLLVLPGPGRSGVDWLNSLSESVVVVRAKEVRSQLTPAETWVQSSITAEVTSVVKSSQPVSVGMMVTLEQNCGVIDVAGKRLTALVPWLTPIEVNKDYLLFGSFPGGPGQPMLYRGYEILHNGRLKALDQNEAESNAQVHEPVDGARLTDVVARVQQLAKGLQ